MTTNNDIGMKKTLFVAFAIIIAIHCNLNAQKTDIDISSFSKDTVNRPLAIDTLDTNDKYTKLVLLNNLTWRFLFIERPKIDSSSIYDKYWDTKTLHAYKSYPADSIPDEVDICLIDSTHHYNPPITGVVRSGYSFRRTREHQGIDIPLHTGDTVRAAFDGVVRYIGFTRETGGYGNLVIIRHDNGLETYYGHLSKHLTTVGETVKAGEIIGLGGSTGRSTGPHLHFEVRYKGQTFDPARLINFETGELRTPLLTLHKHYFSIYSHYGQTDEESKAAAGRIVHTIRSGDTLSGLAARYGTTISRICQLNGISSNKVLRIGERIIVR